MVKSFWQAPLLITGTLALRVSYLCLRSINAAKTVLTAVLDPPHAPKRRLAGATFVPVSSLVLGGVEQEHAGSVSGLLQTTRSLAAQSGSGLA